ncbi:TRAM domain-containing protein [Haloarchaeobius sp. HME9146]|uniref:TRAM domain-containing protein n=1 Tax=Haloarchaeobius sp. HME9146 TaxID=2978732 RepID=UPI0021C22F27|nr:TRAM domain-containing protein [Haloarchaeobius sp. HME9146]MCT9094637.1 TRAM domain-containing protein [Haloarchaeobius sp. HME9146]
MSDCPLADDCPRFEERIAGMGCAHYGDRGGMEWCKNYDQPISDLKTQPVKPGEQIVVDVTDIHESGAGIGRTDEGFIIFVDGVLPDARAKVEVTKVYNNHAQAEEVERLPMEDEDEDEEEQEPRTSRRSKSGRASRERLGSRDNFWGK